MGILGSLGTEECEWLLTDHVNSFSREDTPGRPGLEPWLGPLASHPSQRALILEIMKLFVIILRIIIMMVIIVIVTVTIAITITILF